MMVKQIVNSPHILLTGASGRIGRALVAPLAERYPLRLLDREPLEGHEDMIVADLNDEDALARAMEGIETVIHLAATPNDAPFMEKLLPDNIIGVYRVFEAAQAAGVRRMVFASTCQTVFGYDHGLTVSALDPIRPRSLYAVTKGFGEILGRRYYEVYGMEFLGVRIGAFTGYGDARLRTVDEVRRLWLSPRDAVTFFVRAIETRDIGYAVVFATSKTDPEYLGRASAREVLGFEPQDDVVEMFGELNAETNEF